MLSGGPTDYSATCSTSRDSVRIEDDWIAPVALEMISEVMKDTVMVNFTQPYMGGNDIDNHTIGMLTLAYHAAWSSIMNTLAHDAETSTFRRAEPTVRASVDRGKLYGWLIMNLSLPLAAALVYIALSFIPVQTIRDTTLAPLMLDLISIKNDRRANGLCDAVALNKEDRKLPRAKFDDHIKNVSNRYNDLPSASGCRNRLVFAERPKIRFTEVVMNLLFPRLQRSLLIWVR